MEPKYLLVLEPNTQKTQMYPYVIYEQMASYILTDKQKTQLVHREPPVISQRFYQSFQSLEAALLALAQLNGGEPILLAYTTKPIDNTFDLNRG